MKRLTLPLFALLFTACSSTPPPTNYYLLRTNVEDQARELEVDSSIALGAVQVAEYLDQPGLVMLTAGDTIRVANYHEWAEPLRSSLRTFLAGEISQRLGRDILMSAPPQFFGTRVDVLVEQFHGNGEGGARLVARWELRREQVIRGWQFAQTQPLGSDGYDSLVAAMTELLRQLSTAVADSLVTLPSQPDGNL